MLPRMLFLWALHVGGREVLRGPPMGAATAAFGRRWPTPWAVLPNEGDDIGWANCSCFRGNLACEGMGEMWRRCHVGSRVKGLRTSGMLGVFICESLCAAGWTPSQGKWVSSRWVLGRDARKMPLHPRPEVRVVGLDELNAWVFIGESLCAAGWTPTQGKLVSSWWGAWAWS
jgi:hypothetical protein